MNTETALSPAFSKFKRKRSRSILGQHGQKNPQNAQTNHILHLAVKKFTSCNSKFHDLGLRGKNCCFSYQFTLSMFLDPVNSNLIKAKQH